MRLGIDFDNTIVCYDALFHRVALEDGWIPASLPANKSDVRNHLRAIGREDVWTEMQGRVYGPRLVQASPFPGVLDFFRACRRAGVDVFVVSHKTRTPFAGEPHDLHQAAWNWLESRGFFDPDDIALPRSHVFLELTKQAKLRRIADCACTHFVDDLPEFLAEANFPPTTRRILFDPNRLYGPEHPFDRLHDWTDAPRRLLGQVSPERATDSRDEHAPDTALRAAVAAMLPTSPPEILRIEPMAGGRNNRVYRVDGGPETPAYVLKRYFRNPGDPRDRFGTERAFYRWIQSRDIQRTPEPIGFDEDRRLALFRFAPGRKLRPGEVEAVHVEQAVAFVAELNSRRDAAATAELPVASESCFTVGEHLERVAGRVDRLATIEPATPVDRDAARFVRERLQPTWSSIRASRLAKLDGSADSPLPPHRRCASPSDFGFHNALLADDGTLRFLDFEYAGWDDPAKLVGDFFCQPQVPVGTEHWDRVVEPLGKVLGWGSDLGLRARLLLPVYRLKWCCILLNEFLPTDASRRAFAAGTSADDDRKAAQLEKARRALPASER